MQLEYGTFWLGIPWLYYIVCLSFRRSCDKFIRSSFHTTLTCTVFISRQSVTMLCALPKINVPFVVP